MRRSSATRQVSCDFDQDRSIYTEMDFVYSYGVGAFTYHGPQNRGNYWLNLLSAPAPKTAGATPPTPVLKVRPFAAILWRTCSMATRLQRVGPGPLCSVCAAAPHGMGAIAARCCASADAGRPHAQLHHPSCGD